MARVVVIGLFLSFALCASLPAAAPTLGPDKGYLVIVGGGTSPAEIMSRFVTLAGGAEANFVVIPTAQGDRGLALERLQKSFSANFGVKNVAVLHTRDPKQANATDFVEPLRHASGVWIEG